MRLSDKYGIKIKKKLRADRTEKYLEMEYQSK
jgi:hypothetical protein